MEKFKTLYIIRDLFTKGIVEKQGYIENIDDPIFIHVKLKNGRDELYLYGEIFESFDDAIKEAENQRKSKIEELKQEIEDIKEMFLY